MSACLLILTLSLAQTGTTIVAEVNGTPITTEELQLQLSLGGVTGEPTSRIRAATIENLVERALIERFLKSRKTEANPQQLAIAVQAASQALADRNIDVENEKLLEKHLALPLAWQKHVRRVLTDEQIREYHAEHQSELDGTRLRVSQIFIKYLDGENQDEAPTTTEKLAAIRDSITTKSATFADAVRQHSESPTAAAGGDVGWIGPRGGLPRAVSRAAFALDQGKVSDVILSPFGAHLVTVTEVDPGDLSAEDARPEILSRLSRALWEKTVAAERTKSEIRILEP